MFYLNHPNLSLIVTIFNLCVSSLFVIGGEVQGSLALASQVRARSL